MLAAAIDTLMDRTILPGYSRYGLQIRNRLRPAEPLARMEGKVVLVTGATSGIGLAAASGFARLGATVLMLARDEQRGERARSEVAAVPGAAGVHLLLCDLSDIDAVAELGLRFERICGSLDVLVHNAGVLCTQRTLNSAGLELTFATNVLAPFLLTRLLEPILSASAPARIISVTSGGMYGRRIDVGDLQNERGSFSGTAAYARSKRAEMILTRLWAQRLAGDGIGAYAMHPGWVATPGLDAALPRFRTLASPLLRNAEQGAETILWLGASEQQQLRSGALYMDRRQRPEHLTPLTRESAAERQLLWSECERLAEPFALAAQRRRDEPENPPRPGSVREQP